MEYIVLPKDAEGREIPLDTKVLYDECGNEYEVSRYCCSVRQSIPERVWEAVMLDSLTYYTSRLSITPPDSFEKLEEDLRKILNHPKKIVCAYFNRERKDCDGCRIENCEGSCSHACLEDIMTRIHELRGDN